jgi:hypothetical protein
MDLGIIIFCSKDRPAEKATNSLKDTLNRFVDDPENLEDPV